MELMGQWAPAVQRDESAEHERPRRRPRLVPLPGGRRWRRRADRRRRRRQRVRRRQGRAARGDRLPEVLHRRRQPDKLNTDGGGLPTTVGTEATITDPNLQAVLDGRGAAAVHPAVPRPGDLARRSARRSTRRRWRCSPGSPHPADRVPDHHRRGATPVRRDYGTDRSDRQRSGPAQPARSIPRARGRRMTALGAAAAHRGQALALVDDRAVPAARRSRCTSCSCCSRSSRPAYFSLYKWNGLSRSPTSSASRTTRPRSATTSSATPSCNNGSGDRAVAGDPDPVLARRSR